MADVCSYIPTHVLRSLKAGVTNRRCGALGLGSVWSASSLTVYIPRAITLPATRFVLATDHRGIRSC